MIATTFIEFCWLALSAFVAGGFWSLGSRIVTRIVG